MTTIKAGDILYSSWGYEQTNINWYAVVKRAGQWVTLQEVEGQMVYDSATMTGRTIPSPDKPIGQPLRRKVYQDSYTGAEEFTRIKTYSLAHIWDGRPKWYSTYG